MKKIFITTIILIGFSAYAQTSLTLEQCYEKARINYPLIKQKDYIAQSKEYNVSNVWKGYFPQITISGQATYQSDATSIPISLPGMKADALTKDQYKAIADVSQTIWDGGVISSQAGIQKASAEADDQKVEVELLKVKDRVNQLYFGILLLDDQLKQTDLTKRDLNASLEKLKAALQNGTATKPNVDVMKAELLKTVQRKIELQLSRKAYLEMLGLLINIKLEENTKLNKPKIENISSSENNRPELKLYAAQENLIDNQSGLTLAKVLPKASLFFQGGYGKPTLNMLKNDFDWYYIAGAKLSWSPSNFYTFGNEREINELNKKSIESQKETFLLNTNLTLKQQSSEIEKLKELIKVDKEIIAIRESVKESSRAQLENGVITSNDYIRDVNAEDQARQNLSIHAIQLLLAKQSYMLTLGN